MASLLLHGCALIVLAWATFPLAFPRNLSLQTARPAVETVEFEADVMEFDLNIEPQTLEFTINEAFEDDSSIEVLGSGLELDDARAHVSMSEIDVPGDALSELGPRLDSEGLTLSGLGGRTAANKATLLHRGGGTRSSELAVQRGLAWLAGHQYRDGSWNFDHEQSECEGRCASPGSYREARAAATGLALLSFLGAGHTQEKGPYQRTVYRGIYALVQMIRASEHGGSFWDPQGRMYSHGIATMAICEAFALTGDPALRDVAQSAIDYICYAQDPEGGGWRYAPRQAGDTSVLGWQIGALKSGHLSHLNVPPGVVRKASDFLNTMMVDGGARYLYDRAHPENRPAVTAVALLSRMVMGTSRAAPELQAGIETLSRSGPSATDAYYNYYGAQALFHFTSGSGPIWNSWNEKMRSMLIKTQSKTGHEAGSWTPAQRGDHGGKSGGRLYRTALSTMTLEVYYRMLPIYRTEVVTGDFEP